MQDLPFKLLTVLKVELVEVHALHQVPQRLRLEGGQARITDSPGREEKSREETNVSHPPPLPATTTTTTTYLYTNSSTSRHTAGRP